jgi:hypothetical protein
VLDERLTFVGDEGVDEATSVACPMSRTIGSILL